jgi:hypothetical protein
MNVVKIQTVHRPPQPTLHGFTCISGSCVVLPWGGPVPALLIFLYCYDPGGLEPNEGDGLLREKWF